MLKYTVCSLIKTHLTLEIILNVVIAAPQRSPKNVVRENVANYINDEYCTVFHSIPWTALEERESCAHVPLRWALSPSPWYHLSSSSLVSRWRWKPADGGELMGSVAQPQFASKPCQHVCCFPWLLTCFRCTRYLNPPRLGWDQAAFLSCWSGCCHSWKVDDPRLQMLPSTFLLPLVHPLTHRFTYPSRHAGGRLKAERNR